MNEPINIGEPVEALLESKEDQAALGWCILLTILLIAAIAAFSVTFGLLMASGRYTDSLKESLTHCRSQLSESRLFEREALLSEQEAWKQLQIERSTLAAASSPQDHSTGLDDATNPVESRVAATPQRKEDR